jgi:hypothetical protein
MYFNFLILKELPIQEKLMKFAYAVFLCGSLAAVSSVFAQAGESCEDRVRKLENRIAALEERLGASSVPKPEVKKQQGYSDARSPERTYSGSWQESADHYGRSPEVYSSREYPVAVMLVEKSLEEKGPGEESDRLGFQFEFRNCGREHVTSFSGIIDIHTSNGETVQSFPFDIATYVTVGDKTGWYVSIPFSNVNSVHRNLLSAEVRDLTAILRLKQVMYYDTRVETFE